jgi:hypothetical protein
VAQVSPQAAEACAAPDARLGEELASLEPVRDESLQGELAPRASAAPRADVRFALAEQRAERLQDGSAVPRGDDLLPADCSAPVALQDDSAARVLAAQQDDSVAPEQPVRDAPLQPVDWPVDSLVDLPAPPQAGWAVQQLAD